MTALLPSETQLTSGEQHSAPHIHHALPHFSLYGSLFLLPANLRSFAPTISRSSRRSPIHHQRYKTTTHTSKTAHLTFLSTDYAAGVLLLFPFYGLTCFSRPGRRDRTADLLMRHGLPYKR